MAKLKEVSLAELAKMGGETIKVQFFSDRFDAKVVLLAGDHHLSMKVGMAQNCLDGRNAFRCAPYKYGYWLATGAHVDYRAQNMHFFATSKAGEITDTLPTCIADIPMLHLESKGIHCHRSLDSISAELRCGHVVRLCSSYISWDFRNASREIVNDMNSVFTAFGIAWEAKLREGRIVCEAGNFMSGPCEMIYSRRLPMLLSHGAIVPKDDDYKELFELSSMSINAIQWTADASYHTDIGCVDNPVPMCGGRLFKDYTSACKSEKAESVYSAVEHSGTLGILFDIATSTKKSDYAPTVGENGSTVTLKNGKQICEMKIVKGMKVLSPSIASMPDHVARVVVDKISSYHSGKATLHTGKDLLEVYNKGIGCSSCMTGLRDLDDAEDEGFITDEAESLLDIYVADESKVGVMVFEAQNKSARALLWTTDDGTKVLDAVYPRDSACLPFIVEWCRTNNIRTSYPFHRTDADTSGLQMDDSPDVTFKDIIVPHYWPYTDSYNYVYTDAAMGCRGTVILAREYRDRGSYAIAGELQRTDGSICFTN